MSKLEFGKQIGRTLQGLLTRFVLQKGRKPNNLEMILLKREAAQTGVEERKIISMVDRQPVNADEPIMGGQNLKKEFISETDDEIIARLKKGNKDSLNRLKNKKDKPDDMATGGRAGYYGGGQAMVGEDLSEIGHGADALMARNMQLAPNSQATTSTGLNYLLGQDNDTVRIPYGKGKLAKKAVDEGRRGFMKAAGAGAAGIAALKTGLLGFGEKVAPAAYDAAKDVKKIVEGVPPYFMKLVNKIRKLGDDVTETGALSERQNVKQYKDYTLTEDAATGRLEVQKIKTGAGEDFAKDNFGNGLTEEVYMSYQPGEVLEGAGKMKPLKTADEYQEGTAYLRNDGPNTGDIYEEVSGVTDDILKEVGEEIPEVIRKGQADGGRIGYKVGKFVKGIKGIAGLLKKSKKKNREMTPDELEIFDAEIGDNIEAYSFDGTVEDGARILKEEADYAAEMLAEYKSIGGSKRLGGPKDPMADAIDNASPGYTGDLKYDAQLVADDLAEKMYGVEYDDLTQVQQMDLYDKAYTGLSKNQQGFKEMQKLSKPTKTLEGIKNTGTIDISNPDVAEEFTKFIKESNPKGFKDIKQKIQLESFDPKKTKGNAKGGRITYSSGGLAKMLGE